MKLVVYCAGIIYSLFLHNNHLITFGTQLKINTENPFPDYLDVISDVILFVHLPSI